MANWTKSHFHEANENYRTARTEKNTAVLRIEIDIVSLIQVEQGSISGLGSVQASIQFPIRLLWNREQTETSGILIREKK